MDALFNDAKNLIYALIATLFGVGAHVWKRTEAKVDALESSKVSKSDFAILASKVDGKAEDSEMDRQRDNIAKIFDKLDEHVRRSEARHVELLTALHEGLSRKADK